MLNKIIIENFFSIAERQELTFAIPDTSPQLPCFIPSSSNPEVRLPAAIGIFGSNASGKSTVLRSIFSTFSFACMSFQLEGLGQLFQAYRQKKWQTKPTIIIIEFDGKMNEQESSILFKYELHISHSTKNLLEKEVDYEAMFYAPKGKLRCLYERKKQQFHFGSEFADKNDPRAQSIRPNASVMSTFAQLNHSLSNYLCKQIGALQTNIVGINNIRQNIIHCLSIYNNDKECLARLNRELKRFDVGIESMLIEQTAQGPIAKFKHTGLDDFIFLQEESTGTQRFIEVFFRLHYVLEKGGIAVIDEIDNDLHPLLLPELLRWFSDSHRNTKRAQLLFAAHSPTLLDDLEKEQIFFSEKRYGQATEIYGARDIKGLRREPSLMKKYLAGELGAVPHIG